MGGRTWATKKRILEALYKGKLNGRMPTGTDLANALGKALPTISTHLAELATAGYAEEGSSRKQWRLTAKGVEYVRSHRPVSEVLMLRGAIAAGPALPVQESFTERLPLGDFDPETHYALRVRGTSMEGYGIYDGDIVICRSISSWLDAPLGAIVVARVPEGTGEDGPGWLEALDQVVYREGMSLPLLDHVTLKKLDAPFRAYLQQGQSAFRARVGLKGSNGTFAAVAVAIDGYVVESRRRYG